jgi:hypothetical protein
MLLITFVFIETFSRNYFNPKNLQFRHPRESGDPSKVLIKMDSRFRGNDEIDIFVKNSVIFASHKKPLIKL